jgi:hypothetical protein
MASSPPLNKGLVAGGLPQLPTLLDRRTIAKGKPNGFICPIAIQEAWIHLPALCALKACGIASLAPLQLSVGCEATPKSSEGILPTPSICRCRAKCSELWQAPGDAGLCGVAVQHTRQQGAPPDAPPDRSQRGALNRAHVAAPEGQVFTLHDDVTLHNQLDTLLAMDGELARHSQDIGLTRPMRMMALWSPAPSPEEAIM